MLTRPLWIALPILVLTLTGCASAPLPEQPPATPPCEVSPRLLLAQPNPEPAPTTMLVSDLLTRADYLEAEVYKSLRRQDALAAEVQLCLKREQGEGGE